ncbi:MAG TPA: hypothetical protein GX716_00695 [Firmicutes bacterium]|nr:hypothetical protein [Candidatus Fermentithermobacillaceae bacterium]
MVEAPPHRPLYLVEVIFLSKAYYGEAVGQSDVGKWAGHTELGHGISAFRERQAMLDSNLAHLSVIVAYHCPEAFGAIFASTGQVLNGVLKHLCLQV